MEVEHLTLGEWEEAMPSSGYEAFHTPEALSVLGEHAAGDLVIVGGFEGETLVAGFPAFVRAGPVGRAVLSPPPKMGVPRLGPLVFYDGPDQERRETIGRAFVDAVLEELGAHDRLSVVRVRCPLEFSDPRPFHGQSFDVDPAFTYLVDADAPDVDTVFDSFSSSLRREIRKARDSDLTVSREGVEAVDRIVAQVRDRYAAENDVIGVEEAYARDLVTALGDRARVYVARDPAGEYRSGIVTLFADDTAYFWLGGVRDDYEYEREDESTTRFSVNAALHWQVLSDVVTDPALAAIDTYDLVGANTPRLCDYKSKFGGSLGQYCVVESAGTATKLAKSGYQLLSRYEVL